MSDVIDPPADSRDAPRPRRRRLAVVLAVGVVGAALLLIWPGSGRPPRRVWCVISLEGALDFDSVATRPGGRALPAEQRGEPGWGEGPVGGGGSGYWGYALLHSTPSASARALAWCRLIALEPAVTYRYDLSSDDLVTVDGVCWAPFELRDDPR